MDRTTASVVSLARKRVSHAGKMIVCMLTALTLVACGEAPQRRAIDPQPSHAVAYQQFVGIELGTEIAAAERKLGPPKRKWSDPSRGTCAAWDRVDQQPMPDKPAFIACFQDGRLTSKSILDPDASD